jgi:peptide deformylase
VTSKNALMAAIPSLLATTSTVVAKNDRLEMVYIGDPILDTPTEPVTEFDHQTNTLLQPLHTLYAKMRELMIRSAGVGLAAPQFGLNKSIAIVEVDDMKMFMCNPKIVGGGGTQKGPEGCLSIPGFEVDTMRHENVTVEYQDWFGELHSVSASGFAARAFQHEVDHLNGKLFIYSAVNGSPRQIRRAAERHTEKKLRKLKINGT